MVEIPKTQIILFRFELTINTTETQCSQWSVLYGIWWSHWSEFPNWLLYENP